MKINQNLPQKKLRVSYHNYRRKENGLIPYILHTDSTFEILTSSSKLLQNPIPKLLSIPQPSLSEIITLNHPLTSLPTMFPYFKTNSHPTSDTTSPSSPLSSFPPTSLTIPLQMPQPKTILKLVLTPEWRPLPISGKSGKVPSFF